MLLVEALAVWIGLGLLALPFALALGRAAAAGDRLIADGPIDEQQHLHMAATLPRQRLGNARVFSLKPSRVVASRNLMTRRHRA